jgi:hypothetical protein
MSSKVVFVPQVQVTGDASARERRAPNSSCIPHKSKSRRAVLALYVPNWSVTYKYTLATDASMHMCFGGAHHFMHSATDLKSLDSLAVNDFANEENHIEVACNMLGNSCCAQCSKGENLHFDVEVYHSSTLASASDADIQLGALIIL